MTNSKNKKNSGKGKPSANKPSSASTINQEPPVTPEPTPLASIPSEAVIENSTVIEEVPVEELPIVPSPLKFELQELPENMTERVEELSYEEIVFEPTFEGATSTLGTEFSAINTENNMADKQETKDDNEIEEFASEGSTPAGDDGPWRKVPDSNMSVATAVTDDEHLDHLLTMSSPRLSSPYSRKSQSSTPSRAPQLPGNSSELDAKALFSPREEIINLPPIAENVIEPVSPSENILESWLRVFSTENIAPSFPAIVYIQEFLQENKIIASILKIVSPAFPVIFKIVNFLLTVIVAVSIFFVDNILPILIQILNTWWFIIVVLPFKIAKRGFQILHRLFLIGLVFFLNRAPGGHRVLKALNGHVMKH